MADPVDEIAGRLYSLPLEEFTRERDASARELRKAKERDAAATVAKLPKPSQAAWAANALTREQRGLVDDLLAAGEQLREAQDAAVAGKGAAALRDAGAAERAAVDALVEAAGDLKPGGRKPTAATLERLRTTLHAAASDEQVRTALDQGRLVEDVTGGGAWGLFGIDEPAATKSARGAKASRGKATAQVPTRRYEIVAPRHRGRRQARGARAKGARGGRGGRARGAAEARGRAARGPRRAPVTRPRARAGREGGHSGRRAPRRGARAGRGGRG